MSNGYTKKLHSETFFIDPDEGLNEGALKQVDLVVTQLPVAVGDYPQEKYLVTAGKKYHPWSENPWEDVLGNDPLGNMYDLQRFLDKYYFMDVAVIYLRGKVSYTDDGSVELSGGNPVYTKRLAEIYEASKHADNKPTKFMFNVFEDDGTTEIDDAIATVRLGNKEVVIEYDEDDNMYIGYVYGIGNGTLTIEATGFEDYVLPVSLSYNGVISYTKLRQDDGYADTYLKIVMVAEEA